MNTMKQDQNDGRLTDLAKLKSDIAAAMPERAPLPSIKAPPVQTGPMPDYVEHQDGVRARRSARVPRPWCATTKPQRREIEAMGAEMIDAARKCEAMTAEVHLAIAYMHETAAAYREDAKRIFRDSESRICYVPPTPSDRSARPARRCEGKGFRQITQPRPPEAFGRLLVALLGPALRFPTCSGEVSLRSAAITESAVMRPVFGFSDGTSRFPS